MNYRAVIASFVTTLALLTAIASLRTRDRSRGSSESSEIQDALAFSKANASLSQLRARRIDPASGRILLAEGYTRETVEQSIADVQSPRLEARYDPEGWLDTALDLDDLGWLNEERLACAATHGAEFTDECHLSFKMAVKRTETRHGEVVGATVEQADFSDLLESDAPQSERCGALASCLAQARIGAKLSLPPGPLGEFVGIDDKRVLSWTAPDMFDPDQVSRVIEVYREANEATERNWEAIERDPIALEIYESNLRRVAHYERHLERLLAQHP